MRCNVEGKPDERDRDREPGAGRGGPQYGAISEALQRGARNARAPSREDDEDEALRSEAAEEEQTLP